MYILTLISRNNSQLSLNFCFIQSRLLSKWMIFILYITVCNKHNPDPEPKYLRWFHVIFAKYVNFKITNSKLYLPVYATTEQRNVSEKREKESLFRCHGYQVWFSRDEAPNDDTSPRGDLDLWLSSLFFISNWH